MSKKYFILLLQAVFVLAAYYMLSSYVSDVILLVSFIALAFILVGYGYTGKKGFAFNLESLCDAQKYLDKINAKLANKDESYLMLYRSYGSLFSGDLSTVASDINQVDVSILNKKERFMYEEVKLKLLYYNKDTEGYKAKLIEITNGEFNKAFTNELLVFKAPLYLLKGQYKELIDLMFELIPVLKNRLRVIEAEYYLSLAYLGLGKEADAIAVLEFIVKRDFNLDYTVQSKKMLDKIQEN